MQKRRAPFGKLHGMRKKSLPRLRKIQPIVTENPERRTQSNLQKLLDQPEKKNRVQLRLNGLFLSLPLPPNFPFPKKIYRVYAPKNTTMVDDINSRTFVCHPNIAKAANNVSLFPSFAIPPNSCKTPVGAGQEN